MQRSAALLAAMILTACASGHTSQKRANIPKPTIQIVQVTNINEVAPTVPSGIPVHYEFQITNKAAVPITLKRISMDALAGGGFDLESKSRPFDVTIAPGETRSVDFVTTVYIDTRNYSSQAPVAIRAESLFDSSEGSLQTITQTRVTANSGR